MKDRFVWRSRWAAVGAAIAVSIGGGGVFLAAAAPGPAESTIVNVTPARVLDTRDPVNVGLPGPFVSPVSQKLQVTGSVPTTGGTATVVPAGATGVLLNVTAVAPTADGFISVRPGDATGAPATSSLNVEAGSNVPNAVQVAVPTSGANAGKIDITYDAYGTAGPTTDILVDIVGYTTNAGLQELVADVTTLQTDVTMLQTDVTTLQTDVTTLQTDVTTLQTDLADLEAQVAPLVNTVAAFASGEQILPLAAAAQTVRSVSLMPPADGTVIVNSSADLQQSGGAELLGRCSITTGSTMDFDHLQLTHVAVGDQSTIGGTRGFNVTGGVLLTVNLVCDVFSGAGNLRDSALTAIFAPS